MNDIIGRYAELRLAADTYLANGMPVPFKIAREMERIELRAEATLSPEQITQALQHVDQAKERILQREAHGRQVQADRGANKVTRGLTKGMLNQKDGLTVEQLRAVSKGKSIKTRPAHIVYKPEAAKKLAAQKGKQYFGHPLSAKAWENKLDRLVDKQPSEVRAFAKQLGVKASQLDELEADVAEWRETRYVHETLRRNSVREVPDEQTFTPTDDEQRRAAVATAYIDTFDEDDQNEVDTLTDSIRSESLEADDRRGDVARAFAQEEANATQ